MLETVPTVELPPETLFTLQATDLFVDPVTVAVNCWVFPAVTVAVAGLIATPTTGVGLPPMLPPPPQATCQAARHTATANSRMRCFIALLLSFEVADGRNCLRKETAKNLIL